MAQMIHAGSSDTISYPKIDLVILPVRELLQQYFNIAFLMGKPQDVSRAANQMKIGVVLALLTYVMALAIPYGPFRALIQAIIDLGCTAIILSVALSVVGLKNRFEQAFGGLCGASAFINLAALPLYALRPMGPASQGSSLSLLADFVLLVWGLSLLGHIIRHTFGISMVLSIVISFIYFVFLSTLISSVLPMPALTDNPLSSLDTQWLFTLIRQVAA